MNLMLKHVDVLLKKQNLQKDLFELSVVFFMESVFKEGSGNWFDELSTTNEKLYNTVHNAAMMARINVSLNFNDVDVYTDET